MRTKKGDLDYTDRRGFVERCHGRRIPIMRRLVRCEIEVEVEGSPEIDIVEATAIDRLLA